MERDLCRTQWMPQKKGWQEEGIHPSSPRGSTPPGCRRWFVPYAFSPYYWTSTVREGRAFKRLTDIIKMTPTFCITLGSLIHMFPPKPCHDLGKHAALSVHFIEERVKAQSTALPFNQAHWAIFLNPLSILVSNYWISSGLPEALLKEEHWLQTLNKCRPPRPHPPWPWSYILCAGGSALQPSARHLCSSSLTLP